MVNTYSNSGLATLGKKLDLTKWYCRYLWYWKWSVSVTSKTFWRCW